MAPFGPEHLQSVGRDLMRPECVLTGSDGTLFCSDARGGIMKIESDGTQTRLGEQPGLIPNGIARCADGSFLLANVGPAGGVWRFETSGVCRQLDLEVDGRPLPEVNFVYVDDQGRLWLSVSSSGAPDPLFTADASEGYIVLGDESGLRVVATGLGWTNELRVNSAGDRLFVNETFGRRLLEFSVEADGSLVDRKVLATFGKGDFPDGMAMDTEGGIWIVSIISNRVYRFKDGELTLIFSDSDPQLIEDLERQFLGQGLLRKDLHGLVTGAKVNNVSSIAFGGPDGRTAFLGSLNGTTLWSLEVPFTGIRPPSGALCSVFRNVDTSQ